MERKEDLKASIFQMDIPEMDNLTGIYTSAAFYHKTKKVLLENQDKKYVMIFLNIRGFTLINEYYGSDKGNDILIQLARALLEGIGSDGTCGRIIADNFICCIQCKKEGDELRFFKYVEANFKTLRKEFHFTLECGFYKIDDLQIPVSVMCDRAKFAMINIKEGIGEAYAYYDVDIAKRYWNEQRIIADMEKGLTERQFYVMFQPIYDSATGRPISAEALVRWKHPDLGIVAPGLFIPLFEKNGFIRELDMYVWEEVCKMQSRLSKKGLAVHPVSINVSRMDLYNPGLLDAIEGLLAKYGLSKNMIKLEITETAYMEKPKDIVGLVANLRNHGFEILMDDFGSGYSSLNILKEMPIDTLKIDMRFLEELTTSKRAGNILISVVRMAKMLKMRTVAEGVETKEQLEFLKNVGCDMIQGYYFSKPLTVEEYEKLMEEEPAIFKETKIYKKGVLVVDDVTMLRKSLMESLGDEYAYYEAATGKEALEILHKNVSNIGIIITDIFMPEMDGFELIGKLQENPIYSHIPIIVITASEERENEIKALKLGAVDVITKPYDAIIVRHRVQNVIKLSEIEWLQMGIKLLQGESDIQEEN